MVVQSPDDGGTDLIEGVFVIDPKAVPRLAVGEGGTGWILAVANDNSYRPVALLCPASD